MSVGQSSADRPATAAAAMERPASARSRRTSIASTMTVATEHSQLSDTSRAARRSGIRSPSRGGHYPRELLSEQYQAAISRQNQLEEVVADLQEQVRSLGADNERRQDSYMRREEELKAQIVRLEDQIRVARGERPTHPAFGKASENIKELHTMVVGKIEELLDAQATTLRAEEHTTLRRFATRLNELEGQVAAERGTPSKSEGEWMEKTVALRQELNTTQDIAQMLDKKYQLLAEENSRLKAQFKLQEDDREYLIKQTVGLKKENAALRNEVAALLGDVSALTEEREELMGAVGQQQQQQQQQVLLLQGGQTGALGGAGPGAGSITHDAVQIKIQRYEDVIDSLKRLLEAERRRAKQARTAHTLELQQRTGIQGILRQCVEDVRERRKGLEANEVREQHHAERAQARTRPVSAAYAPPACASVSRPVSAAFGRSSSSGLAARSRPHSAFLSAAGAGPSGRLSGNGGAQEGDPWVGDGALSPRSRAALVDALLTHEELLKLLFDKSFPGVTPHPPGDPLLDKMSSWQEQRDAQVVANAKVLAAAKAGALPPSAAVKESTPGGLLAKEAAAKPWLLNVDAMMAQFLQGGAASAAGAGGGAAEPHGRAQHAGRR